MKLRSFAILILALVVWPVWAGPTQPAAVSILPVTKDVGAAWAAIPDALQYAKGQKLTQIYDGGYERYIDAGVLDAARNLYQRKSDMVEVTVHTMKSAKASETFFNEETKANHANRIRFALSRPPGAAAPPKYAMAIASSKEQCLGYAYAGKYYITVTSMYGGAKARNEAGGFLGVVLKKAAKQK